MNLPALRVATRRWPLHPPRPNLPTLPTVWKLLGLAVGVAAVFPIVWHQLHVRGELRFVDLDVYRSAGQSVLVGRPVYAYLTPPPQLLPFTYPPVSAVLAVPLAAIPWLAAQWAWTLAQVALLAGVTAVAFRPALRRFGTAAPLALGAAMAAMAWLLPLRDGIRFGQVDVMLLTLCLADCVVRRPRWPRGALIGLALAVKLTPAVFVPYLWLTGRRRAAMVALATSAGLSVAVQLLIPIDSSDYWTGALFNSDRLGSNTGTSNQSLRGMILRAGLPHGLESVLLLAAVITVAAVGYRRARALSRAGDEVAGVAVIGLLAVLLSPVAWIHHLAWVVLVLGVLAGDLRDRRRVLAGVAVGVIYGLPLPWWGAHEFHVHHLAASAALLQNSFGIVAVMLVATLPGRRLARTAVSTPARAEPIGAVIAS